MGIWGFWLVGNENIIPFNVLQIHMCLEVIDVLNALNVSFAFPSLPFDWIILELSCVNHSISALYADMA